MDFVACKTVREYKRNQEKIQANRKENKPASPNQRTTSRVHSRTIIPDGSAPTKLDTADPACEKFTITKKATANQEKRDGPNQPPNQGEQGIRATFERGGTRAIETRKGKAETERKAKLTTHPTGYNNAAQRKISGGH